MSRLSFVSLATLALAMFFGVGWVVDSPIRAQATGGQAVNTVTVDGVKIKGSFYEGTKKNAPTVLMLHPVGDGKSSKSADWKNLADRLAKAGYSVMMFDFRGHGESTEIADTAAFWSIPANRNGVKSKEKDSIDVKDYINSTQYLPILVNDIAAIKAFLDRKHDLGSCNTSNTIVIGAENGGTLGAIWINSEWNRYKLTPPTMFGKLPVIDKRAEANDIIAGVFLSITPNLSPKRIVSVPAILTNACKTHGMAATFFYGEKDTKAKDYAQTLESKLKIKGNKKHEYIAGVEVPNTSLSGIKLLQKSLETNQAILKHLENVVSDRSNEYIERDALNALYIWRVPGLLQPISAKKTKGDKTLHFDTYERFIPQ